MDDMIETATRCPVVKDTTAITLDIIKYWYKQQGL